MQACLLYDRTCIECGECDRCDLEPSKLCDNCCKCIESEAEFRAIEVDAILEDE